MYSILYNIAMLLSLSIFFATYPFKSFKRLSSHQVIVGVVIGLSGILVMLNPLVITEGLFFDSRTILLVVSGMVFGAIPTLIGAAMMVIYRLPQGGSGIFTGLFTIVMSSTIGIIWHQALKRSWNTGTSKPSSWSRWVWSPTSGCFSPSISSLPATAVRRCA